MIDYDKLKMAHELSRKYWDLTKTEIKIESHFYASVNDAHISAILPGDKLKIYDAEDLAYKIEELINEITKYKIGQIVWRLSDEYLPVSFKITGINDALYLDEQENPFCLSGWIEEQIYSSKEELIESQIKYWSDLKMDYCLNEKTTPTKCPLCNQFRVSDGMCWVLGCNYKETCRHEFDGKNYAHCLGDEPSNKCIKCGEFYYDN